MLSKDDFIPAGFRLLVKPDMVEDTVTQGDIKFYIASDKKLEQAGQMSGKLVKIGKHAWPEGNWAEEGDGLYYFRYAGHAVELDGEEYRLINDTDVIGVIPKKD